MWKRILLVSIIAIILLIGVFTTAQPVELSDAEGDIAKPYADIISIKVEFVEDTLVITVKIKELIDTVPEGINWLGYDVLISVNESGSNFWDVYPGYYFLYLLDWGLGEGGAFPYDQELSIPVYVHKGAPGAWSWEPLEGKNFTLIIKKDGTMIWKVKREYIGNPENVRIAFSTTVGSQGWSLWENDFIPDRGQEPISVKYVPPPWYMTKIAGIPLLYILIALIAVIVILAMAFYVKKKRKTKG